LTSKSPFDNVHVLPESQWLGGVTVECGDCFRTVASLTARSSRMSENGGKVLQPITSCYQAAFSTGDRWKINKHIFLGNTGQVRIRRSSGQGKGHRREMSSGHPQV